MSKNEPKFIDKSQIIDLINDEFDKDVYGIYIAKNVSDIVLLKNKKLLLYNDEVNYDFLLELRIFDEHKEIYIWKSGSSFKYRIRVDREKDDYTDIIEKKYYIWGTSLNVESNWLTLIEERGTRIHIYSKEKLKLPLSYRVINYLKKNDDGTVCFMDNRIAGIYDSNNLMLGGER